MAFSVLHKVSLNDNKHCGVWDSISQTWVFEGEYQACFDWKHEQELAEQVDGATGYWVE